MSNQAKVVIKSATADLVRDMIDGCIERTGNTQEEIALKTGFVRANVLTMIKQGRTRMPLDKIGAFAKACGVRPDRLTKTALAEYQPELARLVSQVYKSSSYEGIEEIVDLVNQAVTERTLEVKKHLHERAVDGIEIMQAKRVLGELDLSPPKRIALKAFIKKNLVRVTAGSDVISLEPPPTEVPEPSPAQ